MTVRAKFNLSSYTTQLYATGYEKQADGTTPDYSRPIVGEVRTLSFQPVSSGSEENKKFFASTPSGEIKLGILSESAWSQFKLNKEYYIDFIEAE